MIINTEIVDALKCGGRPVCSEKGRNPERRS